MDGILFLHPDYAAKLGLLTTDGYVHGYLTVFAQQETFFSNPADFAGKNVAIIDKVYFSEDIINQYGEQANIIWALTRISHKGIEKCRKCCINWWNIKILTKTTRTTL